MLTALFLVKCVFPLYYYYCYDQKMYCGGDISFDFLLFFNQKLMFRATVTLEMFVEIW